jgi:hypothetical protein
MAVEIRPEPDEAERKAILAALAAEEEERRLTSGWTAALLLVRDQDEGEP